MMEGIVTFCLIIFGLILLYRYVRENKARSTSRIPTVWGYPFIGCATKLDQNKLHEQFSEFAKIYGNMFQFRLFGRTTLVLNTADSVIKAFSLDNNNDRAELYVAEKITGQIGMSMRDRDIVHGKLRKYFTQSLHFYGDGIPAFEETIKEAIHSVMDQIRSYNGEEFEVTGFTRAFPVNVIKILLIGVPATKLDVDIFATGIDLLDFFFIPNINLLLTKLPFLRFAPFLKSKYDLLVRITDVMMDVLFYKMKETWTPGKIRGIVDWYFQEQENEIEGGKEEILTDEMIRATIVDLIVAGIATTATVLPSTILCLVHHPEYQQKIQEELDRVVGKDREPSVSDRKECHLLQAVVMEAMRLLTPIPFLLPHVCSEDTLFEGNFIAKNTQILANVWHIHHDENVWTDPWAFRPERFLDEDGKLLQNSDDVMKNWLPFGIGRRKCPGASLALTRVFLFLSFLLKRWTFVPVPGKCGSFDPRKGDFDGKTLFRAKPFFCMAKDRC